MELVIDPEFADKIPPLTEDEYRLLEENILADGKIISPLITWNGIIVDGHNRYRILQAHPEIPYETMEMEFPDRYAVIVWICRNQLGRRNLTDEQKKFLTGKRYEAEKKQNQWRGNQYVSSDEEESGLGEKRPSQNPERTSAIIAKEIGKGERYVRDAEIYANGVEAADEVTPGIKNEILSGKLKCKDKDVMAIARAAPEQREDLVRKLQFPSARAAPGSPVISSTGEEDEVPDEEPAAPAEDTIEDVMYELNDALESMIFRWNFCFETHDAIYRQKTNQKRIRLLAKEGINYLKNIGG
ncbi:MAG: hypothetical protein IIT86_05590 [Oscillospiraceae bacterium]|nr:hypothetical protein [Oscillospiraceae bacterium]